MRALALALTFSCAVAHADASAPTFELVGNELKLPAPVLFETGSDKLKPESDAALHHVRDYLAAKTYISLMRIEVHTDNLGNVDYNQRLSEKRAMAIARALVALGIDCNRLIPVGFGATKPVAPNDTAENRAKNRRIAFANAALRGRPIGGLPVDGGGRVAGDPCR